jgi:hypothetical protein
MSDEAGMDGVVRRQPNKGGAKSAAGVARPSQASAAQPKKPTPPAAPPSPSVAAPEMAGSKGEKVSARTGTGVDAAAGGAEVRPASAGRSSRKRKQAHLRLTRLGLPSVMKMSFLFAVCVAVVMFVALLVLWGILQASGAIDSAQNLLTSVMGNPDGTTNIQLSQFLNSARVIGFFAVLSVVNVIVLTLLGTVFGALYNAAGLIFGGLEMTLEV